MILSRRTHPYLLVAALALVLALANTAPVAAQGEQPDTPGIIHGTGTHFEVTDSDWLNVTVDSSAEITLFLSSSPQIINMTVEAAADAASAEITLGGLEAHTTYWKYEDGGVDGVEFAADASGSYTFTQDLSEAHNILIQPGRGTVVIDNTGADCTSIGTWDSATKTCTLTQDVNDMIRITTSGVTLDGAGHQVNLPSWGYVEVRGANHTVKNLTINGWDGYGYPTGYGVVLGRASNCTVTNVAVSNAYYGIWVESSTDNTVSDNTISGAVDGVYIAWSDHNILSGNTMSPYWTSYRYGVFLHYYASGNTITGNTISNFEYGLRFDDKSSNNTAYHNNFVDNTYAQIWLGPYSTGNVFHLPAPDGGNYYTVFDEPAEGCYDENGDGFCDSPYTFKGGQDGLPWTTQSGWEDDAPPQITSDVLADPNPAPVNTAITVSANVDDSSTGNSNIADAEYSLDGGAWSDMAPSDGSFDSPSEDVWATLPGFSEAGVHEVCVRGTDAAGNTSLGEDCTLVAVYDPEGGFVTGGGWIWSEPGWCQLDEVCAGAEGRANFGFVSKYKKGASVPTGNTEFNFSAGGLNFHSDEYDWLVVNQDGTNAQYKGQGTINGDPGPGDGYKFMLWATDGDNKDPPDDDTFRIKIWYEDGDSEIVVYDNGFDQAIGGGNIKVHDGR